ncbi:Protein FAR1-RELATED SEQUENCE 11 [Artemisia annua]|uniref:Protein FAR1-RELATED SEQUENCE n=1 Tax=Artemisia annua TaxID=35608 RepID=A0A2U1M2N2_ARTAN|nr:Protein FAR1-RELATED SEQUENCE 11 [Artemisia annua]
MQEKILFDLNETYFDDNFETVEEPAIVHDDISLEIVDTPFIGQCFLSEEEAFAFYQKFAKHNGFSIRKGRFTNDKDGEMNRRDFFCHRQGKPDPKKVDHSKEQRNRGSSRCGCKAHMRIALRKTNEIFPEEWHVATFSLEHNHELLSAKEVRFLPSYRTITKEDEKRILMLKECGLSVKQIMRVMEVEKDVPHGQLQFLSKDVHNFLSKIHEMHSQNDAKELLQYCVQSKYENPNFQYVYKLDEENKLEHIFWSPAHCFDWYQKYGDVVSFDTTYKVNSYDMPFGIFVGVDNHGRTILFGCALLRNETTNTFKWLLKIKTHGLQKQLQKKCLSTKHAFCIWHITSKFSGWFNSILRSDYSSWCSEFYSLYKLDTIEEFEQQWPSVIAKYNLKENKHVIGLYQIKSFWVPAYLRGFFFGGMTTTGRSESINAFIKRFISSKTCLTQFIRQVDLAIEDVEQTQIHDTMLEKYRGSFMRTESPLEEQAHRLLTPYAFKKFQLEFGRAIQYMVHKQTCTSFIVKHHQPTWGNKHEVFWDGSVGKCSCKNYEFVGILCRHILCVLIHEDCFNIPITYWPSRWSREVVSPTHNKSSINSTLINNDELVIDETIKVVQRPPKSKPKGRPKNKQVKGGMETAKRRKCCSICKGVGHNASTCPNKEKYAMNGAASIRASKKKKIMLEHQDLNPVFALKY